MIRRGHIFSVVAVAIALALGFTQASKSLGQHTTPATATAVTPDALAARHTERNTATTVLSDSARQALSLRLASLAPSPATRPEQVLHATVGSSAVATVATHPTTTIGNVEDARRLLTLEIRRGDSLYTLFKRHRLSQASLARLMRSSVAARKLHSLRPGAKLVLESNAAGHLLRLRYFPPKGGALELQRENIDTPFSARRLVPTAESLRSVPATPQIPTDRLAEGANSATIRTTIRVRRGDSLAAIFKRLGAPSRQIPALLQAPDGATLKRLMPGQRLDFDLRGDGNVQALTFRPDALRSLELRRHGSEFVSRWRATEIEHHIAHATARIGQSLFVAGQRAGLSDKLIMALAEIFGWDIDFALDIRPGDRFTVVYEELYGTDGKRLGDGPVLAADFVNRGRLFRAVRFTRPDGRSEYFSPDGFSMRKTFLRTPVNFTRISSRFSHARFHPVLHRIRAHTGVDYAAPRGTPIKAAGDGKVYFVGRKGGYGKAIGLRHGATYSTFYGHMSRFARGIRPGKRVRQGQIIGYVGSTGLATGPHLHYEFRVRGKARNPLEVKFPKAAPIAARLRPAFEAQTGKLVAELEALTQTKLAAAAQ